MISKLLRLLVILGTLIALLIMLLVTPLGLKAALLAAKEFSPGKLSYQRAHGLIIGPVTIDNFRYQNQSDIILIKRLHLNWNLLSLINKRASIKALSITDADITLNNAKAPKKPSSTSKISFKNPFILPVKLSIKNVKLQNITLHTNAINKPLIIKQLSLNAVVDNKHTDIHLQSTLTSPETVHLNLQSKGTPKHYTLKLSLRGKNLDWALTGKGGAQGFEAHTTATKLFANNTASLQLNEGHHWQGHWALKIHKLDTILPGNNGSIVSSGTASGNPQGISSTGSLTIAGLRWQKNEAQKIHATWAIHRLGKVSSSLSLTAMRATFGGTNFHSAAIKLTGTQRHHQLTININQNNNIYKASLTGSYTNSNWQGSLQTFSLQSPSFGNWTLPQRAQFQISDTAASVKNLCLNSAQHGSLCFRAHWSKNMPWELQLSGKNIKPSRFTQLLSSNLNISSTANISLKAAGNENKLKTLHASLQVNRGHINYYFGEKRMSTPFGGAELTSKLTSKGLETQLSMSFQHNQKIQANLSLPDYTGAQAFSTHQKITGKVSINLGDLKILSAFIPNLKTPKGSFTSTLNIFGTLENPQVNGNVNLANAAFEIPTLGLKLDHVTAEINSKKNVINYTLRAESRNKPLTLKGTANLKNGKLHLASTLNGDNVLIANSPEYVIYISPNMSIKVDDRTVQVAGTVTIPKAEIKPRDFRNTVTMPEDEIVYIGNPNTKKQSPWLVALDMKILLGKQVYVNTFGASGRLEGDLNLRSTPAKPINTTGKILIKDGQYSAYGTSLQLSNDSFVHYAHDALNNPSIYLKAFKKINTTSAAGLQQISETDITVGIEVTGHLKNPKITLFSSNSALSQTDILSYIVLGSSSSQAAGNNMGIVLKAAEGLHQGDGNAGGHESMISKLQKGLGLSEFGTQSSTSVDALGNPISEQQSFVVGKQFSKHIFVQYSQGLSSTSGTNVNQLTVRYLIKKHWAIQTNASNLGTGADLLYTINKN